MQIAQRILMMMSITRQTSRITRDTSHVTHHTSHVIRHTSHITSQIITRVSQACIALRLKIGIVSFIYEEKGGILRRVAVKMICGLRFRAAIQIKKRQNATIATTAAAAAACMRAKRTHTFNTARATLIRKRCHMRHQTHVFAHKTSVGLSQQQ